MNDRTSELRRQSLDTPVSLSPERAEIVTEFYLSNLGRHSPPVMRALCFRHICERKSTWVGDLELIVGERGPAPKAVPTYPELTCHSLDDLEILSTREKTRYAVDARCREIYREKVIPFWSGRSMRDRIFAALPPEWHASYEAGIFTEFMEQRAPGHTVLDDKIYRKGLLDFKREIAESMASLDFEADPKAYERREQLVAMEISCDAAILLAERHAEVALRRTESEGDARRRAELLKIADVCRRVPAHAPRDFHEALQHYWFCHLAVITELNGWDAFSPGHLDHHLLPFYRRGLADGSLTPESARELVECLFVKFNNHPAPPKVGVTAAESGTYTDFANINLGGLLPDGSDGSNEVSDLILDIIDEMHLLQPSSNVQISRKTPERFLRHALEVVRKGYGFPSVFNADAVVEEQLRQGKSLVDARAGGCSGCVEVGAFGKEAYILTGYFNLPKVLELALHSGVDPATGKRLGPGTPPAGSIKTFEEFYDAFLDQLEHFVEVKIRGSRVIQAMYAASMPAPFLSLLTDDCISRGVDYNAGGARYNNTYLQFVGIGTLTDSLSSIRHLAFAEGGPGLEGLVAAMDADFSGAEGLKREIMGRVPRYGNDDDRADDLMVKAFGSLFSLVDGRPDGRGGSYRVEMLPTTCHIYFGSKTGATPDGRHARAPLSEGISPVQGADRLGPTAVMKSAGKMDQVKTGGTLLNMKFTPSALDGAAGLGGLAGLVRGYFKMDGHHVQFNVVDAATLRAAQADPDSHRDLIVRVAGYSDYFCDLGRDLQEEIIARTEHGAPGPAPS